MKPIPMLVLFCACLLCSLQASVPPPLPGPLAGAQAVVVKGEVLVFGGVATFESQAQGYVLRLEHGAQTWKVSRTADKSPAIGSVVTINDRVFATLTMNPSSVDVIVDSLAEFDLATGAWKLLSPLPCPRTGESLVAVGDNLLILGGFDNQNRNLRIVEEYDLDAAKWTRKKDMLRGRHAAQAVTCGGTLYILGGVTDSFDDEVREVDALDLGQNTWAEVKGLSFPTAYFSAITVGAQAFVTSGWSKGKPQPIRKVDLTTMTSTTCAMPWTQRHHTAAVIVDRELWIIGGAPHKGNPVALIEAFPITD